MIRIEDIVEKVAANHAQADLDLLRRAYLFSAKEHKGQKRASGESYLVHPLEVANILADMKLDEVSVATGLLHDVVEDTLVDLETIRKYFGEEITHLVDGLTKIAQISNISREEQQAENVRKMLLAMIDDVRVVLVKLADRLHNMRTLQYLNSEKRKRIAEETMEIFAPIAHRLGMGKLRGELEDLADVLLQCAANLLVFVGVNKRADAFVGENLGEQTFVNPAVDNVDALDASLARGRSVDGFGTDFRIEGIFVFGENRV